MCCYQFPILSTPVSSVDTDKTVSPILIIGGQEGSGKGQFNEHSSIFVSSDGLYYAGDTENFRVQIFDAKGEWVDQLRGFDSDAIGNEVQGISEPGKWNYSRRRKSRRTLLF